MPDPASAERVAHLVDPRAAESVDVMGPTVQFLTPPEDGDDAPCVMRGSIPPGGAVPLHSHAEPETFLAVSGAVEGLAHSPGGFTWVRIGPGDVFHVPGGTSHAFRNPRPEPAVMIVVSTGRMGRFFREVGTPVDPGRTAAGPPSVEAVQHFLATAERYGHWIASPEENAEAGVPLPPT